MKILCTGSPIYHGIARSVNEWFIDVDFVSRTTGFDLTTEDGMSKLKSIISNYDVIINNAYVAPGVQRKILNLTDETKFNGHVFSIGSVVEWEKLRHLSPDYSLEKSELRDRSFELMSPSLKTTHITVSGFHDKRPETSNKMNAIEIVKAIQWVLDCKYAVPCISVVEFMKPEN